MTETDMRALFARLDERTKHIESQIGRIVERMDKEYVTQADFLPIKRIVYGLVGAVLFGVAGAVMKLVLAP